MKRRRSSWSKKAKKDYERLEREIAEHEAKGRSESEDRQEKIKVRWDLDQEQLRAAKNPTERKRKEQELKAKKLKELLKSVRDSTRNDDLVDRINELIELVGLQDREIEYLTQFRRDWELIQARYPQQLENLYNASLMASVGLGFPYVPKGKRKPKEEWEHKRRVNKMPGGIGLIEYQFGGAAEAEQQKPLSALKGLPYQPTCLDDIFAGGAVKMHDSEGKMFVFMGTTHRIPKPGLQRLFGMHRNRLQKILRGNEDGPETSHDFRDVTKIMATLLSERPPKCETPVRGAPKRMWLSEPNVRTHALSGIAKRIASMSVEDEIADAFLTVLLPYLPHSAKK